MEITRDSDIETRDSEKGAEAPPRLTLVAKDCSKTAEMPSGDKDWDPYIVWKKLIRRTPDTA